MDPRPLTFIAEATGGALRNGDPRALVARICTDSRQVQPGDLFVALKGERFDAHDFLSEVFQKRPAAVLVQAGRTSTSTASCAVVETGEDTRIALAKLATRYRADFGIPVIAVAGSNGKTTTKELLHSVLRQKGPALCNEASFNNDVGVPLTLLRLEKQHWAAVVEVGTNHSGELEPLLRMAAPGYSVITSIGREHLEHFGTVEEVAREEGWAAELLPDDGTLFINGDTKWADPIAARTKAAVVRIGRGETNDWRVTKARTDQNGTSFSVEARDARFSGSYAMPLIGLHQPVNALLAIAAGAQLGLSREEIQKGLSQCPPPKMRLQVWESQGVSILDDAYNANTDSMIAALQTLQVFPCHGRRIAVLGDMAEQGAYSDAAHVEVGRRAAELGVEQLFTVGQMASRIAKGARDAGLHRVLEFAQVESAGPAVRSFVRPGDVLLLKASRVMRLERIADLFRPSDTAKRI